MKYAFFRLVAISFVSIAITAGILFFLRFLGLSQNHAALKHPLLNLSQYHVKECVPTYTFYCDTPDYKDFILSLNLWVTQDLKFVLSHPQSLDSNEHPISLTLYKDLDSNKYILFEDFIKNNSQSNIIINFFEQDPAKLVSFKSIINQYQLHEKIILQSPYPDTVSFLKKENPLWLFGSSISLQTQLLFMSALYIEPIAKINVDFIISPLNHNQIPLFNARIVEELRRRNIRIILKKNINEVEVPQWLKPDGFFISNPSPKS